jgi:hypothetical protein
MNITENRQHLEESVKQLAADDRFKVFMGAIEGLKQAAIANAAADASLANPGTTSAALGEVRAYLDIQNLVDEYRDREIKT